MKTVGKRIIKLFLVSCILFGIFPLQISAEGLKGSIQIICEDTKENKTISGVSLKLYQVAYVTDTGTYLKSDDFRDANLEVEDFYDDSKVSDNIATLDKYVDSNNVRGLETKQTDDNGVALFSNLEDGIYFIKQINKETDFEDREFTYQTESYFVELPRINGDGAKTRDVTCKPKGVINYPSEKTKITVYKIWKDNNNENKKRPEKINVTLYADGNVYEEVTLMAANNWTYSWENMDASIDWDVKEKVIPSGYSNNIEEQQNEFVITNTYTPGNTTTTNTTSNVKTGDSTPIVYLLILAISSLVVIGILLLYRKRDKNK